MLVTAEAESATVVRLRRPFAGVSFFVRGRWRMVWVDSYFPCVQRAEAGAGGGGEGAAADAGWEPVYARSLGGSREAPPRPRRGECCVWGRLVTAAATD